MRNALSICLFAAVALFMSACADDNIPAGYDVSENPQDAHGVWQSVGYGWIVTLSDEGFTGYDYVGEFCQPNPDLSGPAEAFPSPYLIKHDDAQIQLSIADPAYRYSFTRLPTLPASCDATKHRDPITVFNVFADLMHSHYAFFKERGVDWAEAVAEARPGITPNMAEQDLFDALSALVSKIDDAHLSLRAEIDGQAAVTAPGRGTTGLALRKLAEERGVPAQVLGQQWRTAVQQAIEQDLLQGDGVTTANGWIRYGLLADDVGYLSIMAETDYAESETEDSHTVIERVLTEAIGYFDGARALVLDISLNHGGEDGISRRIARRFTEQQSVAYSKRAGDAEESQQQVIWLRPDPELKNFTKPIYLVTSDHTVSAGEILTMSLKGLPNVTHIGGTTRGALSDILAKSLPNGWILTLSNEIYLDRDGVLWEGRGIEPDQPLQIFHLNDPFAGHTQAIRAVLQQIQSS